MINRWLLLIISLPGKSATPRMRIWRALKASGAGFMREGVYALPQSPQHRALFEKQAQEVRELHGTAYLVEHQVDDQSEAEPLQSLFDRTAEYAAWHEQAAALVNKLKNEARVI